MIQTCACFEDRHPQGHMPRCPRCPVAMRCAEQQTTESPRQNLANQHYARLLPLLLVRVMRTLSQFLT